MFQKTRKQVGGNRSASVPNHLGCSPEEQRNLYYNSKGLQETNLEEAKKLFEQVIQQESNELSSSSSSSNYGPWLYKAMKQLVKLNLRIGDAAAVQKDYQRLLECIAARDVSPNQIEKVSLN